MQIHIRYDLSKGETQAEADTFAREVEELIDCQTDFVITIYVIPVESEW